MSDIVTRLREWVHAVDAVPASDLMDEAAGEIERLNREVSTLIAECQRQKDLLVNNATLTNAERDAVHGAILFLEARGVWAWPATLRALLKRI